VTTFYLSSEMEQSVWMICLFFSLILDVFLFLASPDRGGSRRCRLLNAGVFIALLILLCIAGDAFDKKADLTDLNNHVNNSDIHVSHANMENINTAISGLIAHKEDTDVHITPADREAWAAGAAQAAQAAADAAVTMPEPGESPVLEAVLALPEKYRQIIYLRYYEEYGVDEIAALLGRSPALVSTHLKRGKEKLRNMLGGTEYARGF